jgi:hypothetical protein
MSLSSLDERRDAATHCQNWVILDRAGIVRVIAWRVRWGKTPRKVVQVPSIVEDA